MPPTPPPTAPQVQVFGYEDSQQHDWEIVGGFNGWPGANDPAFAVLPYDEFAFDRFEAWLGVRWFL